MKKHCGKTGKIEEKKKSKTISKNERKTPKILNTLGKYTHVLVKFWTKIGILASCVGVRILATVYEDKFRHCFSKKLDPALILQQNQIGHPAELQKCGDVKHLFGHHLAKIKALLVTLYASQMTTIIPTRFQVVPGRLHHHLDPLSYNEIFVCPKIRNLDNGVSALDN